MGIRFYFLLLFGVYSRCLNAQPTVINTLADFGPGSLRLAIFNSAPGDTIVMSPSLIANGSDTLYFSSYIPIPRSLTIIGAMNSTDTLFFSGNHTTRLFEIDRTGLPSIDVHLQKLAVVEAFYDHNLSANLDNGAGIRLVGPAHVSVKNSLFKENLGIGETYGGAINAHFAKLNIDSSRFINNSVTIGVFPVSTRGGAIYFFNGELHVRHCFFFGNVSNHGGGLSSSESNIHVENCYFEKNQTGSASGIRSNLDTLVILENNRFVDNGTLGTLRIIDGDRVLLKNNYIEELGSSSNAVLGKVTVLESNTYFLLPDVVVGFTGKDTLILNKNTFNWSNSANSNNSTTCISIYNSGISNIPNPLIQITNNTFLFPTKPTSTQHSMEIDLPIPSLKNIRNNIFYAKPNKKTIKVLQGSGPNLFPSVPGGYNIFSDNNFHAGPNDLKSKDSIQLALEPFGFYGGVTPTRIPKPTSVAFNSGFPNDFSPAQNGPIFGIRDRGAGERPVIINDTVSSCFGPVTWWGNTYTNPGVYQDTAANANSLDSAGFLVLTGMEAALVNNGGLLTASANEPSSFQWINCTTGQVVDTGTTFLPAANGSYAAVATAGSCVDTTDCAAYNEVSLEEQPTPHVVVYPNPTTGAVRILSQYGEMPVSYRLSDLQGRWLDQGPFKEPALDWRGLPKGTYLIYFTFRDGSHATERILIIP
jgi:hypothetical protein